jgi:hypothetical protein
MTTKPLRCYDYVNHAYPRVCDAMLAGPLHVFRQATAAAATDTAKLHAKLGPFDIGAEVAIRIIRVDHDTSSERPTMRLQLEWAATSHAGWFPEMKATLAIFPLSPTETQLELEGSYEPPIGKLGAVIDLALMHRVAEASLVRFVQEVAGWLRESLAEPTQVRESVG